MTIKKILYLYIKSILFISHYETITMTFDYHYTQYWIYEYQYRYDNDKKNFLLDFEWLCTTYYYIVIELCI